MKIVLTAHDIAAALEADEMMVLLATLATRPERQDLIDTAAARHNGSGYHRAVAPWLRELAQALEAVEARDAALDAAGRVA
jgi:phage gp29-like protein